MKKLKLNTPKLHLKKSTVSNLSDSQMDKAIGGGGISETACSDTCGSVIIILQPSAACSQVCSAWCPVSEWCSPVSVSK